MQTLDLFERLAQALFLRRGPHGGRAACCRFRRLLFGFLTFELGDVLARQLQVTADAFGLRKALLVHMRADLGAVGLATRSSVISFFIVSIASTYARTALAMLRPCTTRKSDSVCDG